MSDLRLGIFNQIFILTDGEPDDIVALYILAQRIRKATVIVGEGTQLHLKAKRIRPLLPKTWDLYTGFSSDHPFQEEGEVKTDDGILDHGYKILADVAHKGDTLFIVLKPSRELFSIPWQHITRSTLWMYGGYNLRCMMKKYTKRNIEAWLRLFNKVYLYESFYASKEDNVINPDNFPLLEKLIDKIPGLRDLCYRWDLFQLEQTRQQLTEKKETPRLERARIRLRQLTMFGGYQIVLADIGLALTDMDTDYAPCEITIDEKTGYTKMKFWSEDYFQYGIKPIPDIKKRLIKAMDL